MSYLNEIKIEDKVKYKEEFLRSVGLRNNMLFVKARGVIKSIDDLGLGLKLAEIFWVDKRGFQIRELPMKVNIKNLRKVK